jgi:hypothetical protein
MCASYSGNASSAEVALQDGVERAISRNRNVFRTEGAESVHFRILHNEEFYDLCRSPSGPIIKTMKSRWIRLTWHVSMRRGQGSSPSVLNYIFN